MSAERWALILGVSSGAGAAISRALAADPGLNVIGIHRGNHPDGVRAVGEAVVAAGRRFEVLVGDAGKADTIPALADTVREITGEGGVHIVVHAIANASIGYLAKQEPFIHPKQIQKTFESMAHSFVYWTQALIRTGAIGPGSRILALDNAVNENVLSNLGAIAASKAALESYVKYLAWDLRERGIRVNALKYGTVETAALQHIFPADVWTHARDLHHEMFAAGRMVTLEEVGGMVSVLAGEKGAWFNSAIIDFTGGQMHAIYQQLMDRHLASVER